VTHFASPGVPLDAPASELISFQSSRFDCSDWSVVMPPLIGSDEMKSDELRRGNVRFVI